MIEVLLDLCTQCQLCVKTCPSKIFFQKKEGIGTSYEEYCILCGHCLCICPEEAIRHEKLDYKKFQAIPEKTFSPQEFLMVVHERRSIRQFQTKTIPKTLIEEILQTSYYAPTASNSQNVRFLVLLGKAIDPFVTKIRDFYLEILQMLEASSVEDPTMRRRIRKWKIWQEEAKAGNDAIFYTPPAIILISAPKEESMASLNVGFTTNTLMLVAHIHGLGTCANGYAIEALKRRPEIAYELGISEEEQVYAVLSLGYPAIKYQRIPIRNMPKITWKA
jgi:nitroreductase/NAD-dependent dihydropyrimidine dehydrogenase PreA subunit